MILNSATGTILVRMVDVISFTHLYLNSHMLAIRILPSAVYKYVILCIETCPDDSERMANSVDPDHTASSGAV